MIDRTALEGDLPFECPACGARFGFGPSGQAFLSIVTDVPFTDAPTPCCGHLLTGHLVRDVDGRVDLVETGASDE